MDLLREKMSAKFLMLWRTSMGKRVWDVVVFTPLKGQGFQVSTAGPGIFRRCPQWVEDKVIQKPFQCAPLSVASVVCFHNPELGRAICQRVGDLAELDCVNYFVMWYCSSSTWDIAVGNGIKIIIRGRSHICGHK